MFEYLHHVAYVVRDMEEAIRLFRDPCRDPSHDDHFAEAE